MSEKTIKNLSFGSKTIEFELFRQDRKSLGIQVHPDCSVKVIAPLGASNDEIINKLKSKAPWILKQQQDFLSYHPLTPPRKYISGETHLYLGRQYKLRIEGALINEVKLLRGRLIILTKENTSAQKLLNDWYREKAINIFEDLLENSLSKFTRFNISKPELQVRLMPTRWGSCTPNGKVILNPELVKAPKGCIEYVIIHELCHLIHHNHTRAFFELQESIMPDWKKWKDRLERTLV